MKRMTKAIKRELREQVIDNPKGIRRFMQAAFNGEVNGSYDIGDSPSPSRPRHKCGCFYYHSIGSFWSHLTEFHAIRGKYRHKDVLITPLEKYLIPVIAGDLPYLTKSQGSRALGRVIDVIVDEGVKAAAA